MTIINFEEAEKYITEIEAVLEETNLEEKILILKLVNQRLGTRVRREKMKEDLESNPLYGFAKKMMPKSDDTKGAF